MVGVVVRVRSKVQKITPKRAAEMLEANASNRPLSKTTVRAFAEAMRRGDWLVTHQGIAFDTAGVLVDGQHRVAAIVEADLPVKCDHPADRQTTGAQELLASTASR